MFFIVTILATLRDDALEGTRSLVDKEYDTFYFSYAAFLLPTIAGTISLLCSLILVRLILISERNSVYHRIMFMISVADVSSSIAALLSTLPMPSDVIYPFRGISLGNTITCTIQGIAHAWGIGVGFCFNAILSIYYLCTIRYRIPELKFKRQFEPFFVFISLALVSGIDIIFARNKMFNPHPLHNYCSVAYYPLNCDSNDDIECIRGEVEFDGRGIFIGICLASVAIAFLTIIVCMVLIILTFSKGEEALKKGQPEVSSRPKENNAEISSSLDSSHEHQLSTPEFRTEVDRIDNDAVIESKQKDDQHNLTKVVAKQAALYIGAFILTWFFPILSMILTPKANKSTRVIHSLKTIFQTSQGLYNLCIFLHFKIYHIQRVQKNITKRQALWITFQDPGRVPQVFISKLRIIESRAIIRDGGDGGGGDDAQNDNVNYLISDTGANASWLPSSELRSFPNEEDFDDGDLTFNSNGRGTVSVERRSWREKESKASVVSYASESKLRDQPSSNLSGLSYS